jgi:hypothetical protein
MSTISKIQELALTLDGTDKDIALMQQLIQQMADYTAEIGKKDDNKVISIEEVQQKYKVSRTRLTPQERLQVIISEDAPSLICETYDISLSTVRGLKSGSGGYQKLGGCKDYWKSYKSMYKNEIQLLEHAHAKKETLKIADKILDVITSSEAPSILIARYGYLMSTIRQVKSGISHYKNHGGNKQIWEDYKKLHMYEISQLSAEERASYSTTV